jgi:hypothetical protein
MRLKLQRLAISSADTKRLTVNIHLCKHHEMAISNFPDFSNFHNFLPFHN